MQLATILIATDFSEPGARAIEAGGLLARRHGARIVLFHAARPASLGRATPFFPLGMSREEIETILVSEAVDRLRQVRERYLGTLDGVVLEAVPSGTPAAAIHDAADRHGADLVVVGTHGLRGLARVMTRSQAERVARSPRRPVLVVGPDARTEAVLPREVLVAVDFSTASIAAARWAGGLALAAGATVTLFHVDLRDRLVGSTEPEATTSHDERIGQTRLMEAEQRLRALAVQHLPPLLPALVEARPAGDAAAAIIARAERGDGLLVVGTRHGGGTWRATTAQRIVRRSPRPVVVVPDPLPLGRDLDLAPRAVSPHTRVA